MLGDGEQHPSMGCVPFFFELFAVFRQQFSQLGIIHQNNPAFRIHAVDYDIVQGSLSGWP